MYTQQSLHKPYEVQLNWLEGSKGILTSRAVYGSIKVDASLPENQALHGFWTPEHLLLSALASGFMSTFVNLSRSEGLAFSHMECQAVGALVCEEGQEAMPRIDLYVEIYLERDSDCEMGLQLLERAESSCTILKCIKSRVILHPAARLDRHPKMRWEGRSTEAGSAWERPPLRTSGPLSGS